MISEYFKSLPEYEEMVQMLNSFNESPLQIVQEKPETESTQKMIEMLTTTGLVL